MHAEPIVPAEKLFVFGCGAIARRGADYQQTLRLGAQTPEEIAVSVAAEIIAVKYGLEPKVASMKIDYASLVKKES